MPKEDQQKKSNLLHDKYYSMNPKLILKQQSTVFHSDRKTEKEKFEYWFNSTYSILLWFIGCLLIYYVWIINVNATLGYDVRSLKQEQKQLQVQKELLDVKIAELESLSNILKDDVAKDMEKVENPDYLVVKEWVQYVFNN